MEVAAIKVLGNAMPPAFEELIIGIRMACTTS
jgi:hypothetical protein